MKTIAKAFTLILILCILTLPSGCGKTTTVYKLYAIETNGIITQANEDGSSVELRSDGTGCWSFNNLKADITEWNQNGDGFSFTMSSQTLAGTLSNGILTIEFDSQKLIYASHDADLSGIKLQTTDDWIEEMK